LFLGLLRNALGLQQIPPNVVMNGLAIILSIYVMYPVIIETKEAIYPALTGEENRDSEEGKGMTKNQTMKNSQDMTIEKMIELIQLGKEPLKAFLIKHADKAERQFFSAKCHSFVA
jgi:type III secretion protein R